MSQTRWRVRCALALAASCAPIALGGLSISADATSNAVLAADGDVSGPATAVQQAVRVSAPTTPPGATTTTTVGSANLIFPMQLTPKCLLLNNFRDPRTGGTHEGVDILGYVNWAVGQTPNQEVYAVVDGTLGWQKKVGDADAAKSGNSWRVFANGSSTYYMYAHLSSFAPGLENGSKVKQGQVIGYVGDTGNPGTGNYHLHFEVHPTGQPHTVVDPYPIIKPLVGSGCNDVQ